MWKNNEDNPIGHEVKADADRLFIPFVTTTAAQCFSGTFIAVKADMQANPKLNLYDAFKQRYAMNNPAKGMFRGIFNIYQGNFWNYSYTLGCSFLGNNLAQMARQSARAFSDNTYVQSVFSGLVAGFAESSCTTNLVARELSKTTATKLPNFFESYARIFPSLVLRDSIGWIVVQAAALHIEEMEKNHSLSLAYKVSTFIVSGMLAAMLSSPADANLRRMFSAEGVASPAKIFTQTVQKFGFWRTMTAGLKPRIASVSPAFMAYGVAQYWLNNQLDGGHSDNTPKAKFRM